MIPIGEKKLFLLDIDGTICVGNRLIPGADRFLNGLSEYGGDYVFITNNTTMSVADYRKKFAKLGIPTTSANFLTASVATAHYLKQKYGSRPVYVLGTDSLIRELESFGVCTTHDPEKEGIACVLASYDNELTYQKLTDICRLLTERPELDYAATNPDYACPIEFGYVPDCGSICEMIGHAVHRMPTYIGKPGTRMVEMALDMTAEPAMRLFLWETVSIRTLRAQTWRIFLQPLCFQANLHAKKCRTRSILWSMSIHP